MSKLIFFLLTIVLIITGCSQKTTSTIPDTIDRTNGVSICLKQPDAGILPNKNYKLDFSEAKEVVCSYSGDNLSGLNVFFSNKKSYEQAINDTKAAGKWKEVDKFNYKDNAGIVMELPNDNKTYKKYNNKILIAYYQYKDGYIGVSSTGLSNKEIIDFLKKYIDSL
ncbi:MAG: hypothetical protein Q8P20_10055 [bacterium]|nr:hypothetical protein [bacterium]